MLSDASEGMTKDLYFSENSNEKQRKTFKTQVFGL